MPAEYDNLIAKLMVHAHDRDAAIDRLRRALDETEIGGVQTTLPFHRVVARSAAFRDGDLSTGWVEQHWDGDAVGTAAVRSALLAAGLAAIADGTGHGRDGCRPPLRPGSRRVHRAAMAGGTGPAARGVERWPS